MPRRGLVEGTIPSRWSSELSDVVSALSGFMKTCRADVNPPVTTTGIGWIARLLAAILAATAATILASSSVPCLDNLTGDRIAFGRRFGDEASERGDFAACHSLQLHPPQNVPNIGQIQRVDNTVPQHCRLRHVHHSRVSRQSSPAVPTRNCCPDRPTLVPNHPIASYYPACRVRNTMNPCRQSTRFPSRRPGRPSMPHASRGQRRSRPRARAPTL